MIFESFNYKKLLRLGKDLGYLAVGLPFMADPQVLLSFIDVRFKNTVGNLLDNGSERDEVMGIIIGEIPNGQEKTVASMINYAMEKAPANGKRRILNRPIHGKEHITAVQVLRSAGSVYHRGDSITGRR